jgi:carbon storage regulator
MQRNFSQVKENTMLILTRRVGEQVLINNGLIEISVLQSQNGFIRLGFKAPSDVVIDRKEVHLKKLVNNQLLRDK